MNMIFSKIEWYVRYGEKLSLVTPVVLIMAEKNPSENEYRCTYTHAPEYIKYH